MNMCKQNFKVLPNNSPEPEWEQWKGRQSLLDDEIHEAWANRNMKEAYKLLRQLAASKFDVKKRDWRLVKQALPSREEWETLLKKEGCEGGMSATVEK